MALEDIKCGPSGGSSGNTKCALLTDKYEKLAKIGQGTFGEVYKGCRKNSKNQKLVAMKKILVEVNSEGFPITALREIKFLQRLEHVNIIKLLDICYTKGKEENACKNIFYLIFEYCDYDLAGILKSKNLTFSLPHKKNVMKQLLNGLYFTHRLKVIHRDIKAANILLTREGVLKLADFGLSRLDSSKNRRHTNRVVTLWYRPPELLLGARDYGSEIDMWGVGCIMAELWTRKPLLPGSTEVQQLKNILNVCGSVSEEVWPGVSKLPTYNQLEDIGFRGPRRLKERLKSDVDDQRAIDLIDRLMAMDPAKRVNCDQALEDDFFWVDPLPSPSLLPMLARLAPVHELDTMPERRTTTARTNGQLQQQQQQQQQQQLASQNHTATRRHHPYNATRRQPRCGSAQLPSGQLQDRLF